MGKSRGSIRFRFNLWVIILHRWCCGLLIAELWEVCDVWLSLLW